MALSGVHIACGYIGAAGWNGAAQALLGSIAWSQTMASAGTTSQGAPSISQATGAPSYEIYASIDVYVAIGPNPDPVNGPRIFVPALTTRNVFCNGNDKLAWAVA